MVAGGGHRKLLHGSTAFISADQPPPSSIGGTRAREEDLASRAGVGGDCQREQFQPEPPFQVVRNDGGRRGLGGMTQIPTQPVARREGASSRAE